MLIAISIQNLAVVESVQLHFHAGFHVFTGETGAGKSIIMDAFGLIGGARGSSDLVRHGCNRAEIEASFELPADHPVWDTLLRLGIQADRNEGLIIRRELTAHGKSMCRVNGQMVNLTMLREVGELLIHIHGQHEHQTLLKADRHLEWLDGYGGEELAVRKRKYQGDFADFMALQQELKQLKQMSQQTSQMLDLYRFQIEELDHAQLAAGEDEYLSVEKCKLANAAKLIEDVNHAYEYLYAKGAMDLVSAALSKLASGLEVDQIKLQLIVEQLQSAYYQMEDAAYQLRDYRDHIEFDPVRLEQMEHRLDVLASLKRKYGLTIQEMVPYLQRMKVEVHKMEHKDENIIQLEREAQAKLEKLTSQAEKLTCTRLQLADQLAVRMEQELQHLHMKQTRLQVQLEQLQDKDGFPVNGKQVRFTKNGWDHVEFLMSSNPGEPLRPLHKIASGGELSRMMLAMKTLFAAADQIPVLVFDEVDTGVSGRAAQAIAEKLVEVSVSGQVFAVTHLPQVACMADHQYFIEKGVRAERTFTQVTELDEAGRITELARMLGGVEVTEKTLHHAQEMLKLAAHQKGA